MTSCIATVFRDYYPTVKYWKVVLVISLIGISIGTIYTTPGGQFIINFIDFYGASFVALIFAIIELLTISWVYGVDRFCADIEFMLGKKTGFYWRICWSLITPAMMIAILVYFILTWTPITYQGYEYHPKMHGKFVVINSCSNFCNLLHFQLLGGAFQCCASCNFLSGHSTRWRNNTKNLGRKRSSRRSHPTRCGVQTTVTSVRILQTMS